MPPTTFKNLRLSAIVITLLILAVHPFVPDRKLVLHPQPSTMINIYSDEWDNGNSSIAWKDPNSFTAECHLRDGANYPFCGLAIKFYDQIKTPQASNNQDDNVGITDVDLSQYDGLLIEFDYSGEAERIRFALRNVEFELKQNKELRKAKQAEAYIEADEFNAPIFIDFSLLNISDWWVTENSIRRENTRPAFNNVMEMTLHIPHTTPRGTHTLSPKRIMARGKWLAAKDLYRSIIIFWIIFIIAEAIAHSLRMRREKDHVSNSLRLLKYEYDSLKTSAQIDPITQTLNRRGIETFAYALLNSEALTHYWVCLFDIDNFKSISDKYGHQACDQILTDVVDVIKNLLTEDEELGRWGNEQFLLFSAGGTRQDIFVHCDRLRKAFSVHTFRVDGKPTPQLTLSFGISRIDMHNNFEHSFKKADKALKSAKENGNNQVALASY